MVNTCYIWNLNLNLWLQIEIWVPFTRSDFVQNFRKLRSIRRISEASGSFWHVLSPVFGRLVYQIKLDSRKKWVESKIRKLVFINFFTSIKFVVLNPCKLNWSTTSRTISLRCRKSCFECRTASHQLIRSPSLGALKRLSVIELLQWWSLLLPNKL